MCGIWDWQSTIVGDLNDSQDPKHTLFCRENAFVAIYALFSDNKCPLFTRLGGGVAERGQCHLFLPFFLLRGFPKYMVFINTRISQKQSFHLLRWLNIRVFHENMFLMKKLGSTRSASIWRLVWRNPKGFLILISFRGCTSHFRFDLFYIIDFHSGLTLPDRVTTESKSTM